MRGFSSVEDPNELEELLEDKLLEGFAELWLVVTLCVGVEAGCYLLIEKEILNKYD